MPRVTCYRCGACCKHLLVEADLIDVLREPRLPEAQPHYCGRAIDDVLEELEDEFKVVLLNGAEGCAFLAADNSCSIYPTRPNACVAMAPGDDQCQESRNCEGLSPLKPIEP